MKLEVDEVEEVGVEELIVKIVVEYDDFIFFLC